MTYLNPNYKDCKLKEEIGMYRDLDSAVLCDQDTASAAELFTAAIRDYGLGKIIGTKTFGKGSVQTIMSLAEYGLSGAVRFTTSKYFPPSGTGYDGEGITPDITVELSEEAAGINPFERSDSVDNQIIKAYNKLKK